jgi:hypothetical protein
MSVSRVADRSRGYSRCRCELFERRVPFSVVEIVDDRNAFEMPPRSFRKMRKMALQWSGFVHVNS